jgi:hypothetical protein
MWDKAQERFDRKKFPPWGWISETRVFTAPVHTAPSMLASIVSASAYAVVKVLAICAVGVVGSFNL